jgi:restriction system protein
VDIQSLIPRAVDLVSEVVRALVELGGTASTKDIDNRVIENLGLSTDVIEFRRSHRGSGRTELKYRLAWSRTLAKRRGAISLIGNKTWKLRDA